MHDIALATTDEEIAASYPVMQQLRGHVKESDYVALVRKLQWGGYLLACLRDGDRVVAAAGFRLTSSLAWSDFIYVHDLVTDDATRSAGHGRRLLSWLADYGRAHGCKEMHLDSGVQRFEAHRFYLRERMDITCHHFAMTLQR